MLDPGFYPGRPEGVELRETHASWVFLAGNLAYKLKKPIVLPFLDYGTVSRRREMCRAEVRLNRRLAPSYYLAVDSIVAGPDGFRLLSGEHDGAVEYVVRMQRIPEQRTLESLSARGVLTGDAIDAVGHRIAAFHLAAPEAPPEARETVGLLAPFEENVAELKEIAPPALSGPRMRAAAAFTAAFLIARRGQIEARAGAGAVRDCHGDLRAEHVIVNGSVDVYDCIEFNPSLRLIDVGADLAFLVMDLARLGHADLGSRLVTAYRTAGGDPGDDALVSFYASYRAWVRAKVACFRARELAAGDPARERADSDAQALLALGHVLAWRARSPVVIVVCGVAASGKTALASSLSAVSGLARLSSDLVRKELAGVAPTEPARPEHYTPEFTLGTYRELGRRAHAEVARSGGAIVDATFHLDAERGAFAAELGSLGARVFFAECRAPIEVLIARANARAATGASVSDADAEIVRRQVEEWEPLDQALPERATIDTARSIEDEVVEVEALANLCLGNVP